MTKNDRALKRYYKAVRGWLPCSQKLKKQILAQIQDSVENYLEQNPEADPTQLQAYFGDPQTIAAAYVENTGTAEILKGLRIRRRVVTAVTAALVIALVLWGSVVTWAAMKTHRNINGYGIQRIIVEETSPFIK